MKDRLLRLHGLARQWISADLLPKQGPTWTTAYADLMFAFGLARLGEAGVCGHLQREAARVLEGGDKIHKLLLRAFDYRIRQALEGRPHAGPLPDEPFGSLEKTDRMAAYAVDRMRQQLRILEPDHAVDPYRAWSAKTGPLWQGLNELADLSDREEIASRARRLLDEASRGGSADEALALCLALRQAPRLGEELTVEFLGRLPAVCDALRLTPQRDGIRSEVSLLERGLCAAGYFNRRDWALALVDRFRDLLQTQKRGADLAPTAQAVAPRALEVLNRLGMRTEMEALLSLLVDLIPVRQEVANTKSGRSSAGHAALEVLLHVAGGWLSLGQDEQAEPILDGTRTLLFRNTLPSREQGTLASAYATAVGLARPGATRQRLEELLERLQGVVDTYTTSAHFSLSRLVVVEAVVLAATNQSLRPA